LEDQFNDLSASLITSDEVVNTQRKIQEIEKKMDENKEEIQKCNVLSLSEWAMAHKSFQL
jgi:hypothetical protein